MNTPRCCLAALALSILAADTGAARDWLHKGRRLEANFQRVVGEKVYLRTRDRTIIVQLSDLSAEDQEFVAAPKDRTWTNKEGKRIVAKFVSRTADKVTILKADKEFTLPLEKLSRADQAYLDRKHPFEEAFPVGDSDSPFGPVASTADPVVDNLFPAPMPSARPSSRATIEPSPDPAANLASAGTAEPQRSSQPDPAPAAEAASPIVRTPVRESGQESWTLRTGESVEGSLQRIVVDNVILATAGGVTVLPLNYFSAADQERIQGMLGSGSAGRSTGALAGSTTNSGSTYGGASANSGYAAPTSASTAYPNANSGYAAPTSASTAYPGANSGYAAPTSASTAYPGANSGYAAPTSASTAYPGANSGYAAPTSASTAYPSANSGYAAPTSASTAYPDAAYPSSAGAMGAAPTYSGSDAMASGSAYGSSNAGYAANAAPAYPGGNAMSPGSSYAPATTDYAANTAATSFTPALPSSVGNSQGYEGVCSGCGKIVPAEYDAGDNCPHCGVFFEYSEGPDGRQRQATAQQQRQNVPSWSSGSSGGSSRIRVRGLGKLIFGGVMLLCSLFAGFMKFLFGGGYSNESYDD